MNTISDRTTHHDRQHGTPDAGPNSVNARERAAAGYRKSRVEKVADLFVFVFQTLPAIVVVAGLLVVAVDLLGRLLAR